MKRRDFNFQPSLETQRGKAEGKLLKDKGVKIRRGFKSELLKLEYLKHICIHWEFAPWQAEAIEKRWGGENKVWGLLVDRINEFKKENDGKCERLSRMLITNLKQQGFSIHDIEKKTKLSLEEVEYFYFEQ